MANLEWTKYPSFSFRKLIIFNYGFYLKVICKTILQYLKEKNVRIRHGDIFPIVTKMLPRCYQDATKMLPRYYQDVTKILPRYYQDVTKMLPRCYQDITKILPRCFQDITKILPKCYQNVTKKLPKCYQDITKILPRCYQNVTKNASKGSLIRKAVDKFWPVLFYIKCYCWSQHPP